MKQQINLLIVKERGPRPPLSLTRILLLVLLTCGVFGLSAGVIRHFEREAQQRTALLEKRRAALPVEIARLERQHAEAAASPKLMAAAEALRSDIERTKYLLSLLNPFEGTGVVHHQGFSSYLYDLSGAAQRGIWLTGFEIRQSVRQIHLQGVSERAERVPQLLQSIGEKPAFKGLSVTDFSVEQREGAHHFLVGGAIKGVRDE